MDGQLQAVVWHRPRPDLFIDWLHRSQLSVWRSYWEVRLASGRQLVCFKDLNHSTWYLDPDALMGPEADARVAEIERQAEQSAGWLRAQRAAEEAKAEREAARRNHSRQAE